MLVIYSFSSKHSFNLINAAFSHNAMDTYWTQSVNIQEIFKINAYQHPCIRLARGKFELTNQDSAGGKNSSVLCKVNKSGKAWKSSKFSQRRCVKYPRKGIFTFKNHTSWQKVKSINHFVFLNFYFGAKNACMATRS